MNILIADDNPTNLKLLRVTLEAEGFTVFAALDGREALQVLEREKIDAIISDILMPRMDGYRLCHEVRTSERFKLLPFIIYTASYTSPADEKFSLDLGADKFLRKPAPAEIIVGALHELTTEERYRLPRRVLETRESEVMNEYSERLVAKLEQKNQELQKRTDELRSSEAQLRLQATALDTAANSIVITDRAGKIVWANPAFTAMTGYASAEVIGQTPRLIKSGKHDAAFYRHLWQTILSGQTWRGELTNRRKDGSLYHGEQTITPVRSAEGTITNFIGIMNDVTERKRAEEELRATHTQLRQLLEHSPAVIYSLKIVGRQIVPEVVSDNIERLLGVTATASTNYDWWLGNLHPEDRERAVATLGKAVESGGYSMEYRIRHKDGTYRWVEDNNRVVRNTAGQPVEMVGVWTDITDRKRAEEEISQQTRLALLGADVSVALTRSGPLEELLQHCTELLVRHLDAAFVRIWTLNHKGDVLELKASAGMYTHLDGPHGRVPVGKYKIGLIAQERKPHLTNSVLDDPLVSDKEWAGREGIVAFAGQPLLVEDRLVGVVALFAKHPLSAATLAALASVADGIALGIQRKKLETEVSLREQRLSSFFAGATAGLVLVDEDLRFLQINDTLAEMNGVPAREHLGRTIQEILPKLAPTVLPLFQRVLATGAPILNVEVSGETARQPGVNRHWIESFFPIGGKGAPVEGVGAIVVDVTERKQRRRPCAKARSNSAR